MFPRGPGLALAWLLPALALAMAASLMVGFQVYGPGEAWAAMTRFDGSPAHHVLRDFRLPRVLIAPVVGAALGTAGALVQTLIRNRIASPDIMGLNAGAALAVVVAATWLGIGTLPLLALSAGMGALVTALLVYAIALAAGAMSPARTVLAGITLASLFMSMVQMVLTTDEATLQELVFWLAGSFEGRSLALLVAASWLIAAGVGATLAVVRSLDALQTDDDTARTLGLSLVRIRTLTFLAIAALTGAAVAVAGPVAFIGLVVPHAARALAGTRHAALLPVSAAVGALFAVLADIAARFVIYPTEAPVGAVTALAGAPLLVLLLRRRAA